MRPAQFLAHVQFQQRASEYRVLIRQHEATTGKFSYYATEPEEEAQNERVFRELDRLSDSMAAYWNVLYAGQQAVVKQAGRAVKAP